jgi:hypothetical protein
MDILNTNHFSLTLRILTPRIKNVVVKEKNKRKMYIAPP